MQPTLGKARFVAVVLVTLTVALLLVFRGPTNWASAAETADIKLKPGDELPRGRWVDALQFVDPDWHAVNGDWRREGDELITEPMPLSRIMLPFEIDGSYEIMAEFTRTEGKDNISVLLPVGRRLCPMLLSGWGGQAHGLMRIDGFNSYSFDNPATFRPGKLVNDRRYRVLVSVETKKDKACDTST